MVETESRKQKAEANKYHFYADEQHYNYSFIAFMMIGTNCVNAESLV